MRAASCGRVLPSLVVVAVDDETLTGVVRPRSSASSTRTPDRVRELPCALTERYTLLARIGAGGMGVVYEAHDRELDRRVAMKLLHPGAARTHVRRLLREAQMLARLSHPNLVPVFDVGSVDDDVFVAMELVRGRSLDRIALDDRVPVHERLRMLVDAGRGLVHAHECGLVHRDVKPSNVLVGDDGRARVADFGLARPLRLASADLDDGAPSPDTPDPNAITRPGRIAGTPAYMPPELMVGAPFDEKSDQFSFCICAWEVLHGVRPRRDRSDGAAILPSTPSPLPRRIQAALRRGTSVDPGSRHASMAALLDALQPARRGGLAIGIAAIAIGGVAILGFDEAACDDVAIAWNDARAHELRARIAEIGFTDGEALHAAIAAPLDRYAASWTRAHDDACRAELSTDCLAERRDAADAVIDALLQTDRRAVLLAGPAAVAGLPTPAACSNAPRPSMDHARTRELQRELARVEALAHTGQLALALPQAEQLIAHATAPIHARAVLLRASLQLQLAAPEAALTSYAEAAELAAAAHDDATLADAWLEMARLLAADPDRAREHDDVAAQIEALLDRLGPRASLRARLLESRARMASSQGRFDDAVEHALAAVALLREGDDDLLRARLLGSAGFHLQLAGRYDDAVAYFERAIDSSRHVLGPGHPDLANQLVNLSIVQPPEQSEATLVRAEAILRDAFPDGHPDLAKVLGNLGLRQLDRGAYDEAEATLREAIAMQERAWPEGHPHLGHTLQYLADTLNEVGRRDEALAIAERALAVRRATLPTDHADIGRALRLIGAIHYDAGRVPAARKAYEQALAVFERSLPPDHPLIAGALSGIGECAVVEHDSARALEVCTRALALEQKAHGEDALDLVPHLSCLAAAHQDRGEDEEAVVLLERALVLWSDQDVGPLLPAQIRLQLATSLDRLGRDRPRVVALAQQVLAAIATLPGARERLVAPAERLLNPPT